MEGDVAYVTSPIGWDCYHVTWVRRQKTRPGPYAYCHNTELHDESDLNPGEQMNVINHVWVIKKLSLADILSLPIITGKSNFYHV